VDIDKKGLTERKTFPTIPSPKSMSRNFTDAYTVLPFADAYRTLVYLKK